MYYIVYPVFVFTCIETMERMGKMLSSILLLLKIKINKINNSNCKLHLVGNYLDLCIFTINKEKQNEVRYYGQRIKSIIKK